MSGPTVEEKLQQVFKQHAELLCLVNECGEMLTNVTALLLLLAEILASIPMERLRDFSEDLRVTLRAAITAADPGIAVGIHLENLWQMLPELAGPHLASTLFLLAVNRSHEPKIGAAALAAAAARFFEMHPPERFDPSELVALANSYRAAWPMLEASYSRAEGINAKGGDA